MCSILSFSHKFGRLGGARHQRRKLYRYEGVRSRVGRRFRARHGSASDALILGRRDVKSVILRVPSSAESNYVINVNHPDFTRLILHPSEPFAFHASLRGAAVVIG
jgi:hypothetical protein